MQMRAQGNTWEWMSFIQSLPITQPSHMIDKNSGGLLTPEERLWEVGREGRERWEVKKIPSGAFQICLKASPLGLYWQLTLQAISIFRVSEKLFLKFLPVSVFDS